MAEDKAIHIHNAPVFNITIGRVGKVINGNYYEYKGDECKADNDSSHNSEQSEYHASGKKKYLFVKNNNEYVKDVETTNREAQRLRDFLKAHKLSSNMLTTNKDDILNVYIVEFVRRWLESNLISKNFSGAAVTRFLSEEVGLEKDVCERSYNSKIVKMVATLEVKVQAQLIVAEAFKQ